LVRVGAGDAFPELALLARARLHRDTPAARPERVFGAVEPQPRLARFFVGPVAREAVAGEDQARLVGELAILANLLRGQRGGEDQRGETCDRESSGAAHGATIVVRNRLVRRIVGATRWVAAR